MSYSFDEHLHRYSIWTAARAVQRGFTTTQNIKKAIEGTQLKEIEKLGINTSEYFDEFHILTARQIIDNLKSDSEINASYGQASKIIAIYLKTSVIIRNPESLLAELVHPPLDRILLQGISKKNGLPELKEKNWTCLDQKEYFEIIEKLRNLKYKYFWELEESWNI